MDVLEQALRDRLHLLALLVGQHRVGLGQQIEDGELLLGQVLGRGPLLLLREVLRERDQPAQVLVDVEAARVVLGDQLLDPLDELVPGRVPARRADRPLAQQRGEPLGLGALAAGEPRRERVEVDLR